MDGANTEFLAAVNRRLRKSLAENAQQQSSRKLLKEEQKQYMKKCEQAGLPFARSLCLQFSHLKLELDAGQIRQCLENLKGVTRIQVQSVELVSVADEKNRRNRGKDGRPGAQPAQQQVKEYSGKAYVVFKNLASVAFLKEWADTVKVTENLQLPKGMYDLPLPLAAARFARFKEVRRLGHRMYHEDAHGVKMKAMKLQVGNRVADDALSVWFETGTSDKTIEVEVSRMHRQLKLKFQYGVEKQEWSRYCISIKFRALLGCIMAFEDDNLGGRDRLCLMFTLRHPPHIFKKAPPNPSQAQDVLGAFRSQSSDMFQWSWPVSNDNDGWERTVDFTKDVNAFGTAFTYRLVLVHDDSVQSAIQNLKSFHLIDDRQPAPPRMFLRLERIQYSYSQVAAADFVSKYSKALDQFQAYFEVGWRLRSLLNKGKAYPEQLLSDEVVQLLLEHLHAGRNLNVVAALEDLLAAGNPVTNIYESLRDHPALLIQGPPSPSCSKPSYCIQVPRLVITPTRITCTLGDCELSNRVLRKYEAVADRFLRVNIADEAGDKLHLGEDASKELKLRIYKFLREGVQIGNRHYKFLAFSNSQIRENSCWMFAELDPEAEPSSVAAGFKPKKYTCKRIRKWMGDFSNEKVVAKYAARMGQCFSSSIHACQIGDALEEIPDIKSPIQYQNGMPLQYIFSDGVGRISVEVAYEITRHLRDLKLYTAPLQPSAFQIRLCGCKGMLSTWGDIDGPDGMQALGRTIQIRPSMRKFESDHDDLEVVGWSRFMPGHLNQQVILLLEDRGVGASTFLTLQAEYTRTLDEMVRSKHRALDFLVDLGWDEKSSCLGVVKNMLASGVNVDEPFVSACLQALKGYVMKDLRSKARIHMPRAAMLYGIMDELGMLEYGEVYISIQRPSDKSIEVLVGDVIVTKNPCLHPGDVRKLKARDIPEFRALNICNVVVFPQKGRRPHPSEAAGSDLDGDIYFCCWDSRIVNHVTPAPPWHYQAPKALTKSKVEMKHVVQFFFEMMQNDMLGRVARSWMAFADKEPEGPSSDKCKRLAAKHHEAVDFPKTGVLVELAREEIPYEYPHFMNNKTKPSYTSTKVMGLLYDEANRMNAAPSRQNSSQVYVDKKLVLQGLVPEELWKKCVMAAEKLKLHYENELIKLMNRFEVFSEAELVCGCMLKLSKHRKRRWAGDVREQVLQQVQALWVHFRKRFDDLTCDGMEQLPADLHKMVLASACYYSTYAVSPSGLPLISFPWVMHRELCMLKLREGGA